MAHALAAHQAERLPIGEFTARRMAAPTLDGKIGPGEWDRAFTTSGMITPFGHDLHQVETTVAMGFDDKNFYFLFRCRRGDREWYLRKSVRENDGYSFGDPSIEIWVTPPTLVPETYQSIINTFPAVLDIKMIPTRGYQAQGWKGNWTLGVTESETHYIIEAGIPISDFSAAPLKDGDVWRFLLCRTAQGVRPRAQASWSITQGFAEIPQHVPVRLRHDEAVVQLYGVTSVFTGRYRFPMAVAAPEKEPAEVTVELRWQKGPKPADDDVVVTKTVAVPAGQQKDLVFEGDVPEPLRDPKKKCAFALTATRKNGTRIYRQTFPCVVNGWEPQPKPVRPENATVQEMGIRAMYGPESNVLLVRADIIDLPAREQVAGGTIRLLDPAKNNRVLLSEPVQPFRNWYSSSHFTLGKLRGIPKVDVDQVDRVAAHNAEVEKLNAKLKKQGRKPEPLWRFHNPDPLKVLVEVSATGKDGKALRSATQELDLIRRTYDWTDNAIGITDKVIPPWTPTTYRDATVGVWNRSLQLDGLGMLKKVDNGGVDQIRSMRLVAVQDGEEVAIQASEPLVRHVPAQVDLDGGGEGAGLAVRACTRVEFDGFILHTLSIGPAGVAAKVDKLFLEVVLPEEEATHFCTTAGGWTAVHDVTPARWTSQQTGSGMLIGDFVPYIWLTNSDRAFLWLADSDEGWITDDDRSHPTQEIVREKGTVTLRVHFIELPTELREPTTLTFATQTFPSRPLPPGWRSIICSQRKDLLPSARGTYFWSGSQADWAVLWPYYCSPYPWSLAKSKAFFDRFPLRTDHRPMVGSIAHSIGRYRDYKDHWFKEYAVDWGATPGDLSNANVTQGKGPIDFRLHHYRMWVRDAGFRGLYVDENYIGVERNFLTGGAYIRPDGRLQPGYSYMGLREYFKRLKVMFHENKVDSPNLWQHISSGAAYHAWFGDIFFEGENVEPTNLEYDYIEVLPAARMRAIASAKCAGGVMTMMCQSQRHATVHEPKHTHQFVGWVMAHDVLPEQVRFWEVIAQEARLYEDDVTFRGYWHEDCPVEARTPDCIASVHRTEGRALVWVVNTARKDQTVDVRVDYGDLDLSRSKCVARNAETGEAIELSRRGFTVPVLQRDFVAVHIVQCQELEKGETFRASFEQTHKADEALGCCVLEPVGRDDAFALTQGVKGQGLAIGGGAILWPRLHVSDAEGRLTFHALLAGDKGTIFAATPKKARRDEEPGTPPIAVRLAKGVVQFERLPSKPGAKDGQSLAGQKLATGWHAFELAWTKGRIRLAVDGKPAGELAIEGLDIGSGTGKALTQSARFVFGGGRERLVTTIDEVRCRVK
jgi:hypothetical protein